MPCGPLLCGGRVPGLLQYSVYLVSLFVSLCCFTFGFNLPFKFMPFWLKHSSFVPLPPSLRVLGLGVFGFVVCLPRLIGAEGQTSPCRGVYYVSGGLESVVPLPLHLVCRGRFPPFKGEGAGHSYSASPRSFAGWFGRP